MVKAYLASRPDPSLVGFLEHDFDAAERSLRRRGRRPRSGIFRRSRSATWSAARCRRRSRSSASNRSRRPTQPELYTEDDLAHPPVHGEQHPSSDPQGPAPGSVEPRRVRLVPPAEQRVEPVRGSCATWSDPVLTAEAAVALRRSGWPSRAPPDARPAPRLASSERARTRLRPRRPRRARRVRPLVSKKTRSPGCRSLRRGRSGPPGTAPPPCAAPRSHGALKTYQTKPLQSKPDGIAAAIAIGCPAQSQRGFHDPARLDRRPARVAAPEPARDGKARPGTGTGGARHWTRRSAAALAQTRTTRKRMPFRAHADVRSIGQHAAATDKSGWQPSV